MLFLENGHPGPFFVFGLFQANIINFTTNKCETVYPIYGAGIPTHNLQNVSLLPLPLDKSSHHVLFIRSISRLKLVVLSRFGGITSPPSMQSFSSSIPVTEKGLADWI